jgi:hypothetical protein
MEGTALALSLPPGSCLSIVLLILAVLDRSLLACALFTFFSIAPYLFICLFVCCFVCLSVCLSACLLKCLFVCKITRVSISDSTLSSLPMLLQVLRQYVLELDGVCEKILPLGDLPVPLGDHKDLSSTPTFDGAYVVPFAHHPVDGKSRFVVNKNYALLRDETEMKFRNGILKGKAVEECTCINSRGELVKSGPLSKQIPCDHPCCLAPYRLMYQMKDSRFTGHAEGTSSSSTRAHSNGDEGPALGASWSGYNDVSPQLLQVLADTWKDD